jgi:hypothetical protein
VLRATHRCRRVHRGHLAHHQLVEARRLAAWKDNEKAKTVLVLEQNDIQLTNPSIVADTFLPLALAKADRPDETYLVASCLSPWYAFPVLIGDKSYFDFAKSDEVALWEFDPASLEAMTKR